MSIYKAIWDNLTTHELADRDIQAITHVRNVKVNGQWKEEEYKLHYYSWSACWRELMNRFPDANYEFERFERDGKLYDVMYYPDGSCAVNCIVTINGVSRNMWLPVMDYKNKAVVNPDARAISDTKMRCLVKTIAMFGLGLDIYEGKYEPKVEEPEPTKEEPKQPPKQKSEKPAPINLKVYDYDDKPVSNFSDINSWIKFVEAEKDKGLFKTDANRLVAAKAVSTIADMPITDAQKKKITDRIVAVYGDVVS